ncbi:ETS ous factor [Orchesella cincta]|uniref:ETS ous factor n=1 Tax=Orchesella cincta TaxID=48709 RepID=A0A1D2NB68_ORCCI|nr:ETS ous factor [Orchesella cincta]
MLDCKMSSSLSPVTPVNILSECYIGMWENDMSHQPTKLEPSDIMDFMEPSLNNANGSAQGNNGGEPGSTSPSTIIHHTSRDGAYPSSHPSTSPSSTSSQYLTPLPSLGDPYCTTSECQLLEGFHSGMVSETHAFQEGGYDAFISDLSQQPPHQSNSSHHHHPHHHHHHPQHNPHHQEHHHAAHHHHSHHPPPPHISHIHGGNNGGLASHINNNGVLLLDMSNHHPGHGGQCSPGCPCGGSSGQGHPFCSSNLSMGGDLGICHPSEMPTPNHQDYNWDELHCEPGDYSILLRKGESPTTSDSVSYTDNDSESKSSGGSLSGITEISHVSPPKRKVGRPPKKDKKMKRNEKKTGRLWEFIRDLLKNPEYCPSLVKWENHEEGHFRFVNSEKVAQLWGQIKGNPRMTYEKLSRAMRYYYKSHVFEPVLGRRLVYKFGYNATNWRPVNPNFASSHKMYN